MTAENRRTSARRTERFAAKAVVTALIALGPALTVATVAHAQSAWRGADPGDWFGGGNWAGPVPYVFMEAEIDSGTAVVGSPGAEAANLYVGKSGSGSLRVQNGGTLTIDSFSFIGQLPGAVGSVTVDGAGSIWTTDGDTYVGSSGAGTLAIQNGGTVNNFYGYIGYYSGAVGSVTVDGAGSAWNNSGNLFVGTRGNGTLTIRNGGEVSSLRTYVGYDGATGTVNIGAASGQIAAAPGTLSTEALIFGSGTLVFNHTSGSYVFAPWIFGGAAMRVEAGTTILTGASFYIGGTTISGGTLQLGDGGTSGSIAEDVTNNGTLAFNRSDAVSFSGAITGTGTVNQLGTGTTILTGANLYSGGTTISGGTLQLGDGGISGSIAGDVTNNGTLAFNRSDALSFSGAITGTGAVNQLGTGTTILTGANLYTGATTVSNGTLIVNGSVANSAIGVDPGGTLGGIGTLGNTTINGGTLSPGNSIGTVTVAGNLVQAAASTYLVEVNAAGQSDRTNVTGTATLGGSVQVIAAPGSYSPSRTYTILNGKSVV